MRIPMFAVAALVAVAGCGAPKTGKTPPRVRNMITADEIASVNAANAYEVIKRLQPSFLKTRGVMTHGMTAPTPIVIVDGAPYGELSALYNVSASTIESIQYLDALEATQRFGREGGAGAILITTKR